MPGPLIASGPFHGPAPSTQRTSTAPLLATVNTSVWLGTPNCADVTMGAPIGEGGGAILTSLSYVAQFMPGPMLLSPPPNSVATHTPAGLEGSIAAPE